ncbi:TRAP transporter small permease [Paracoccus rhizosphaerae]|uniref:TRAP transporter small permease protein n=1 Tax=Paracoccus rhizosphaerae TaxID=1133347 RepID=A0ABV6CG68_9RHOB|nr:TRAP transporter small permease [Paracoccus rhizosphaerae]
MGGLSAILHAGGALALAFIMLTIGYDALMRHFFAQATSWSMEVNAFLLVYLALVPAAETLRRGEQIGIGILAENAGPGVQRMLRIIVGLVGVIFCAALTWRGAIMSFDAFSYGERVSSSFGTPMWIPYALIPLGFSVLGMQFILIMLGGSGREKSPRLDGGAF